MYKIVCEKAFLKIEVMNLWIITSGKQCFLSGKNSRKIKSRVI